MEEYEIWLRERERDIDGGEKKFGVRQRSCKKENWRGANYMLGEGQQSTM